MLGCWELNLGLLGLERRMLTRGGTSLGSGLKAQA